MKKLLSIVAVVSLMSTGVNAINSDTFTVSATIPAVASVGLGDTSALASNQLNTLNGTSTLVSGTILTLINVTLGVTSTEFPVHLSTNTKGPVTMKLYAYNLIHENGTTSLTTRFSYIPTGGTETTQTATGHNVVYTLSDGTLKDNAEVGKLKITVKPRSRQLAGVYTKNIRVVIVAAL